MVIQLLQTQRLLLREFCLGDLDDLYSYANNPNVGPNAGWQTHQSKEDSLIVLKDFIEKQEVWAIVDRNTNRVIGSIGLHTDRKRDFSQAKMLGYVLDEPFWGKGLITEAAKEVVRHAFEQQELKVLSVYHYPHNTRSKRVIEKCGFQYEGTLRMASKLFNGMLCDEVCYSITKEEYFRSYLNF